MSKDELKALCKVANWLGNDSMCVFGGGGNCSIKVGDALFIKASGSEMAGLTPNDFVKMHRDKLKEILAANLPGNTIAAEMASRQLVAGARFDGEQGEPSVEVLIHEAMPHSHIFHTHPVLVNGLLCSKNALEATAELFPEALILPYCDPGYPLAKAVAEKLASTDARPNIIFIQNHGLFIGADSSADITKRYEMVENRLCDAYETAGVSQKFEQGVMDIDVVMEQAPLLRTCLGSSTFRAVVNAAQPFTPAPGPFSPHHMTYAGRKPLVGSANAEAVSQFEAAEGYLPRISVVPGKAAFAAGYNLRDAELALDTARNAAHVMQLTQAFGGPNFLNDSACAYVEAVEAAPYHEGIISAIENGILGGKVVLVTGAAQGFGYGIAQDMARRGATVVIADLNLEGAVRAADELISEFGPGTALPVKVNIADEASVEAMTRDIVHRCGGLDVMIANAGVLKAGSVKTLDKKDWDFVTDVNYTGYFLCTKHISRIMAKQNLADGRGGWMDIIQISSKSGLEGSNRNSAYAGSKFGGIGLTQSFAMELVGDRIKVNSICPGNFFDGPLWSDPVKGLFVQYLASDKVPGAKTVDDVRKFYEDKVPMRRGCRPEDVSEAIEYVIKQQYETGQAVPVTGGQVMLN